MRAEGVPGVEGAVAAATALRERQKDADEKLARLRKAIEGPPELEVRSRAPFCFTLCADHAS